MPRCEAASISIRSRNDPLAMAWQWSQLPQVSAWMPSRQFTALASSRAAVVLPVSPFARKQVGMAEPVVDQGVLEGPNHVFLANELVEPLRTVAVVQSLKRRRTRRGHGSLPA